MYQQQNNNDVLNDYKTFHEDLNRELRCWRLQNELRVLHSGNLKNMYEYVNGKLRPSASGYTQTQRQWCVYEY